MASNGVIDSCVMLSQPFGRRERNKSRRARSWRSRSASDACQDLLPEADGLQYLASKGTPFATVWHCPKHPSKIAARSVYVRAHGHAFDVSEKGR